LGNWASGIGHWAEEHWLLVIGYWLLVITRNQETAMPFPYKIIFG
jgi:hypothetical protein